MAFTAQDVKKLREMTNVGMMDCKAALAATDGDIDKAVDWLPCGHLGWQVLSWVLRISGLQPVIL